MGVVRPCLVRGAALHLAFVSLETWRKRHVVWYGRGMGFDALGRCRGGVGAVSALWLSGFQALLVCFDRKFLQSGSLFGLFGYDASGMFAPMACKKRTCKECSRRSGIAYPLCASGGYEPFGMVGCGLLLLVGVWRRERVERANGCLVAAAPEAYTGGCSYRSVLAVGGGLVPVFLEARFGTRTPVYVENGLSCYCRKTFAGYGIGGFSSAYADAQEAYFATGDYALWEEYVAGSPEYAFNEYLQAAVELGIPLTAGLLIVVAFCLWMGMRKGRLGLCGALLSLMIFSFSSYPLQLPVGIVTFPVLLWACVESGGRGAWLLFALLAGGTGLFRLQDDRQMERACREWANVRVLYRAGASRPVTEGYEKLYPVLKERAAFLFEYGHALHKSKQFEASNRILQEALLHSSDPMILNIIGKNHQEMGDYPSAEAWLLRSTHRLPGRIYPYYLLAKLYALPAYRQPDKFEKMKQLVLTKEPKVHSTAVRQMREEVKGLKIKD